MSSCRRPGVTATATNAGLVVRPPTLTDHHSPLISPVELLQHRFREAYGRDVNVKLQVSRLIKS